MEPKKQFKFRPRHFKRAAMVTIYLLVTVMMVASMVSPAFMF